MYRLMIKNNIHYPVEFIVQQEHRYALWVEGDEYGFLKDAGSDSVVYAKTRIELDEMSEREKLNVNFEEVFKINVDLVRGLIDSIDSCVAVDAWKMLCYSGFFQYIPRSGKGC